MRSVFGIDLGTTNSCLARYAAEGAQLLAIDGAYIVPSVVAHDGSDFLVGRRAKNYAQMNPLQAISSIKRRMGDLRYRVELGGAALSPLDVSARILEYLKCAGEAALKELGEDGPVEDVVITVPAWFAEEQRQATLAAGRQAGLNVVRIVHEPTAAALAFSASTVKGDEERWIVYDLGGGTFDVSVLRVRGTVKEVLASCGNCFLGGDDFDARLVELLLTRLSARYTRKLSDDPLLRAKLLRIAEEAKVALSFDPVVPIQEILSLDDGHIELDLEVTRDELESLIAPFVESTVQKMHQALEEARCELPAISRLLLVGGSTKIPFIAETLTNRFGLPPDSSVEPDYSVALGAAIQAGIAAGYEYRTAVLDIAPHSLGVAVVDPEDLERDLFSAMSRADSGALTATKFAPLIRRNSRLPASYTKQFSKLVPGQRVVKVEVYQGESDLVTQNQFIGSFTAPLDADSPDAGVFIGFEYDLNGTVRIAVRDAGSAASWKRFNMDLARSAEENSEGDVFGQLADDAEATDLPAVSNYLIQCVESQLAERPDPAAAQLLEEYRAAIQKADDSVAEHCEDGLYDWLEAAGLQVANS